jgi:hypothetical protein
MAEKIRLKSAKPRLIERITICVDAELLALYQECMGHCEGLTDEIRDHIRKTCLTVQKQIRSKDQKAG